MSAYFYDPYRYPAHKMKGGTFQNFNEKSYLKLTDAEIEKHLNGIQQIGVYPLLQDNTSLFLVADFDKENWKAEAVLFLNTCRRKKFPLIWNGRVPVLDKLIFKSLVQFVFCKTRQH